VTWFDVDAARSYLAQQEGGKRPTRKTIYAMVAAGLRVARVGSTGRRMLFCAEFIDQFLLERSSSRAEVVSIGERRSA